MREIVLDTETTGLDPHDTRDGHNHRILEIGCVELHNYLPTGKTLHLYINPERPVPEGAFKVHGLGNDFLDDKPLFKDVAQEFLDFIADSPLVIHNAEFDMKFLNAELKWADHPLLDNDRAIDTLMIARKKYPGSPASLDALCRRFEVDNGARTLHGALLDCELLSEVYLNLCGGAQPDFGLIEEEDNAHKDEGVALHNSRPVLPPRPHAASDAEISNHHKFIEDKIIDAVWKRYQ